MSRILSLDLARGFTVLFMPAIHTVMLYSKPEIQRSFLGDILGFIAEGPGAQLFMMIMGISFTFSSRTSTRQVLQRTFYLFVAAYVLNILKFILPLQLGWIPDNFLQELQLPNNSSAILFFFLLGDILHFAAIANPILFLVFRLKYYPYWSLAMAMAIIIWSPYVWDMKSGFDFVNYLLQLTGGHPPQVFFPVFPWIVYPLLGLVLGYLLKEFDVTMVFRKAGWAGGAAMLLSRFFSTAKQPMDWLPFYRTEPADTLFHIGFVLTWLALFHWLFLKINLNPVSKMLIFCSRNITSIYIIQWIVICWGMAYSGYLRLGLLHSLLAITTITIITISLTYLLNYAKERYLRYHRHRHRSF